MTHLIWWNTVMCMLVWNLCYVWWLNHEHSLCSMCTFHSRESILSSFHSLFHLAIYDIFSLSTHHTMTRPMCIFKGEREMFMDAILCIQDNAFAWLLTHNYRPLKSSQIKRNEYVFIIIFISLQNNIFMWLKIQMILTCL